MRNTILSTNMAKLIYLINTFVFSAMILTACASPGAVSVSKAQTTSAPAATLPPTGKTAEPAISSEASINIVTDPKLGQILVGNNGMTLYVFKKDTADTSNCNADCLKKWPPLLTQGKPALGDGVDAAMVGSATLADGSKIVTYNHMPLYYFAKDTKAGDTTGQGVGSVWYVISPDGKPIGE